MEVFDVFDVFYSDGSEIERENKLEQCKQSAVGE